MTGTPLACASEWVLSLARAAGARCVESATPSGAPCHTARCEGLSSTITHLDWSVDGRVIMANSQAYELVYFDAATGKQVKDNQRDTKARDAMSLGLPSLSCTCAHPPMPASPIYTLHLGSPDPPVTMTSDSDPCQPRPLSQWATYTGVLGFPVMGVWQPYSDGTDINAVDRSPSQEYVVTADDFGKALPTEKCWWTISQ